MTLEPPPQTPAWFEYHYNPRLTVKDAAAVLPEWRRRALVTREKYPPLGDIKYGPHPRENMDLFRARNARGCIVYIHGGYWRMLSKLETSWVAEGFVEQGLSVALINYPLCPDVRIGDIRNSVQRAFAYLWLHVLSADERAAVVVTGHSAGGHLAAMHLATDWTYFNLPAVPFAGVISLSGVFDVAPLMMTSMNADLRLSAEEVRALNLMTADVTAPAPLVLAVGGDEPGEFHRQSDDLARAWAAIQPRFVPLPDVNHYTIVDHLARPGGVLNMEALAIAERGRAG